MNATKIISLLALSFLILPGCSLLTQNVSQSTTETTPAQDVTAQSSDAAMADQDAMMEEESQTTMEEEADFTIEMKNFEFSLDEIEAQPGQTLTVKLVNTQGTHNFLIDELEVESATIQTGDETTVTFTVPESAESGTQYPFYCAIGNHRALGMEGTLTIL